MICKTAVVVDSASYLPQWLIERHGVRVVPLSVELDGHIYYEGLDLTPDEFYTRLPNAKSVSTSQPSPGRFIECYKAAAEGGAQEILSVHIGSSISGTVQSARLASDSSPIPVTIVDTGQASFAEGLCAWEAIEALVIGKSAPDAADVARVASALVGNTFVVKALDLVRRGGRLLPASEASPQGVPVLALTPEGVRVAATATTLDEAITAMATQVESAVHSAAGRGLRLGVGHAAAPEIAAALRERIADMPGIDEVVDYVVGPAVGAHTGAGSAGAVFLPRPVIA